MVNKAGEGVDEWVFIKRWSKHRYGRSMVGSYSQL